MTLSTETIIAELNKYAACDVADALGKLKHPHGGHLGDLVLLSPTYRGDTKIVGQAYTVKFVRNNHVNAPKPSKNYIDTVPRGAVLFLSAPPRLVNAVYGGLMSLRAQTLGAVGTVIDGRLRDLAEHQSLGYPVFARGTSTFPAAEVCRVSEINVPVRLNSEDQEAWVHPGDYIIADNDGVVCLPQGLAEEVLALIPPAIEADRRVAEDLRKGRTVEEAFKEHRGK